MPPRPERRTVIGVFPCFCAPSGVPAYRIVSAYFPASASQAVYRRISVFPCFCAPSGVPAYHPRISMLPRRERRIGVSHRFPPPGAVSAHCRISLLHDPPGAGTSEHCRSGTAYRRFPSLRPSELRIGVSAYFRTDRRTGVPAYRRKAVLGHYLCPRWHFNASLSGGFTGEPLVGFMPLRPRVPACPCIPDGNRRGLVKL